MSSEHDNTNSGASFINDRKTSENHPDYKGFINVEGVEYWISSWVKVSGPNSKNPGTQFLSHALTLREKVPAKTLGAAPISGTADGITTGGGFSDPEFGEVPPDDDIPF